ncbi:galactose ABC transporter substrate-binding protein [Clostridium beijerinckii]|uniref:galactose ABC transporter substrate-binding protein n=1 Tax=Clostridium beijerinckii TaxID=1520 RepID=UPI00080A6230|nr:galactose ABC transporter substrate-binding protein [Clostridium beijerinckii]OCB00640.1 galactose ABC transporter substrate-binding protein [Clostridium beijerinckii]
MKLFKNALSLIIISILLLHSIEISAYASPNVNSQNQVNIAVFLSNFNSPFISNFKKDLEEVEKENENKVQFTFFDSKGNETIQNQNIDESFNQNFDLFVVDLVNSSTNFSQSALSKIFNRNIPLIVTLIPSDPIINCIRTYNRAVIIGADDAQSGSLQGKILIDTWTSNKETLDRNKDNVIQYIILKGPIGDPSTPLRSKYSIQTINDARIKTEELLSSTCNWNKDCARDDIQSSLLNLYSKVEVIISNNDAMAIGAIEALQKYGFNKGGNSRCIPVVGVDAIPESRKLIDQGFMTGTVIQDTRAYADAIYSVGLNLISGAHPLSHTNYEFDRTGPIIKLPFQEYIKK